MLIALTLFAAPAEACSLYYEPGPIVTPRAGELPPGFVVRTSFGWGYSELLDAEGERVELDHDDFGEKAPDDLAPGAYLLRDTHGNEIEVEVVDDWATMEPEPPLLLGMANWTEKHDTRLTASCFSYMKRKFHHVEVDVEIPAGVGPGWSYAVSDQLGQVRWLEVPDGGGVVQAEWQLGQTVDVDEACLTLALYDPYGDEVWSEGQDCVELGGMGCATGGRTAGLVLLPLVLAGLVRRGRHDS